MHIDTVLKFVVEYPLAWDKDRLVTFGRNTGEVRWTNPKHKQKLLRIRSFISGPPELSNEQQIEQALHEYTGLEISSRTRMTIPAGDALHITGHTARRDVDLYLLLRADRGYAIELTVPRGDTAFDKDIMDRVIHSFQIMRRE